MSRSTNSGGNVGTSFTSLPFSDTVPGNTSEFRLSTQSTRLALRVDADLQNSKVAGHFEMDFHGVDPGNVAVSSSSYGFRLRQAWFDYSKGKFEITGGQLFSLMTPVKRDILPWPGDAAATQGSSNVADRVVEEATGGYSRVLWKHESLGSIQMGIQYAYLFLHPWVAGTGPSQATSNMVLTQLRYNLP